MEDQERPIEIAVDFQLGINNAVSPTSLPKGGYLLRKNAYMNKNGSNAKRMGSTPVVSTALASAIPYLTVYQFPNTVAAGIAPTVTAVGNALSTLPAGTYYARYTYVTDEGETEASAEASVVVPPAVANPTVVPVLGQSVDAGETLPDTTYYVAYTWKNAVGETMVSPEASLLITAGNRLDITIPALPSGATSASIYVGTTTGVLKYQANIAITTHSINAPILTVTAPPVANMCIVANLRVVVPAIPFHANSINFYVSTTTNTEKYQANDTATTYNQSIALLTATAYPTANTTAFDAELLASSGTSLYSLYNGELRSATMTNALASSDIYTLGFKNLALTSILFITDGGNVKFYNGSAVADITPAANDAGPSPANYLATLNGLLPIYCWNFQSHVFISIGDDSAWHSKAGEYDYFPTTYTTRYVRNNDYITGCGVPFGDICLIPMRQGWGVTTYSSSVSTLMTGNLFLNTPNGNIAPRGIQKLTYPDGTQTVAYWSDDGAYEIYDTGYIDSSGSGSRNYATRSLMKEKYDYNAVGFTEAEKIAAESYFDTTLNLFITTIKRGAVNYAFVYDVRTREWDLWENIKAESTIRFNNILYYAGSTKMLHKYDATLATDYDDFAQTTGTIVDWDCYTDVIMMENSGFQSYLDYLIVNAKSFSTTSTIDITIVGTNETSVYEDAVQSTYATWDLSLWDFSVLANTDFSTIVGAPSRTIVKKRAYFFQIRFQNSKNELVELYKYRLIGRVNGQ